MTPRFAEHGRCPRCKRWGGLRQLDQDGRTLLPEHEHARGPCIEGPWHGSLRGPRNACGQWVDWQAPAGNAVPAAEQPQLSGAAAASAPGS